MEGKGPHVDMGGQQDPTLFMQFVMKHLYTAPVEKIAMLTPMAVVPDGVNPESDKQIAFIASNQYRKKDSGGIDEHAFHKEISEHVLRLKSNELCVVDYGKFDYNRDMSAVKASTEGDNLGLWCLHFTPAFKRVAYARVYRAVGRWKFAHWRDLGAEPSDTELLSQILQLPQALDGHMREN